MSIENWDLSTEFYCRRHFHLAAKSPGKHFVKQLHSAGRLCDNIGNLRICSGFSKSIYLSTLRNIYSSTAIHADDQLKTWEQVFHISLQQYVKNRCSQALVLKQYLSLYLYINEPIYFWKTKSMYFHNNWHYIKHLQGYKSILVFKCSSTSFISSPFLLKYLFYFVSLFFFFF